jgi:predicted HTH transcriptional regulator
LICRDKLKSKNKGGEFNVMRSIAAFLNTNDGILFIGVDDKNKNQIIGIEEDFQLLNHDKKDQDGYETI